MNTVIQIKRSTVTPAPANGALEAGELAYSYNSDKLFIGNSTGLGVIEIGGKYVIDIATAAYDQANAANVLAYNTGIGANAYASSVGTAANAYADSVGTAANAYAASVGTAANSYADSVGTAANNYANSTFVKLTDPSQTITGNLSVVGTLTISGNTTFVNAENLRVSDPLIYLAGNNYSSDIVDIGFIANYVNATGSNVHTGLYREHEDKEWYLFQGYDAEPANNHIGALSNNMILAVLNADLKTSNLVLGGINAISWISAAFEAANNAAATANSALVSNTFTTFVVGGTSLVADANSDTLTITSGNGVILVADAGTDSFNIALSPTGVTAATYGSADKVGVFTVDQWGRITSASNASIAIDASAITSGILPVSRGGTGVNTFETHGILYGNSTGSISVTTAGTEGQVLQATASGIPQFGMLDGGAF